jgi:hypothetical protein
VGEEKEAKPLHVRANFAVAIGYDIFLKPL